MKILKGVVKDHRLPHDYKLNTTQPSGSARWMSSFKKAFM